MVLIVKKKINNIDLKVEAVDVFANLKNSLYPLI